MGRGRKLGAAGIAIATAVTASGAGFAQEAELNSSPVVALDVTTEFRADTNRYLDPVSPGTTTTVAEILSLFVLSETNTQVLRFTGSGSFRFQDEPIQGTTTEFANPSAELRYSREVANAAFSVLGFYREADVVDSVYDEFLRPEDLTAGEGTLTTYGGDVELSFGTQSPIGFTIYAGTDVRDYQDTLDTDLNDNTIYEYGVTVDLRFSQITEASLNADWYDYSEEGLDPFDRNETTYSVSLSHELRSDLSATAELGYIQGETTERGEAPNYDEHFVGLDLRKAVVNGAYTGGLFYEQRSDEPDRVSLDVGREMELPAGELAFSLTLTTTDYSDLRLLGSLDYTQEFKRGVLSVYFNQEITSNSDNRDEQISRFLVDYQHEINNVSSFTLAMDLNRTKNAFTGANDGETRADLSASYSHALTADWDLNLGYLHQEYEEFGGDGDARSDSVFLTLTRGFALGF